MKTQTIEVEGLPEGWKAVGYRVGRAGVEHTLDDSMKPMLCHECMTYPVLIVEKIQPRRIVLEETQETRELQEGDFYESQAGYIHQWAWGHVSESKYKVWREVKETDEEPFLKFTKKDMLELIEHIKLGGQLNHKIQEFINDK